MYELRDLTMSLNRPTQLCQDTFTIKDEELRESSFNMTRGVGGGGDEDIETRSLKF